MKYWSNYFYNVGMFSYQAKLFLSSKFLIFNLFTVRTNILQTVLICIKNAIKLLSKCATFWHKLICTVTVMVIWITCCICIYNKPNECTSSEANEATYSLQFLCSIPTTRPVGMTFSSVAPSSSSPSPWPRYKQFH